MEVTIGNLISIVTFAGGLISVYILLVTRVTKQEVKVEILEKGLIKLENDIAHRLSKLEDKIDKIYEKVKHNN